jgi:hypothetical protein
MSSWLAAPKRAYTRCGDGDRYSGIVVGSSAKLDIVGEKPVSLSPVHAHVTAPLRGSQGISVDQPRFESAIDGSSSHKVFSGYHMRICEYSLKRA